MPKVPLLQRERGDMMEFKRYDLQYSKGGCVLADGMPLL